jgi:hypothetical protein
MKYLKIGFVLSLTLGSAAANAGYKLMEAHQPVAVAKSNLTVTPDRRWSKLGARPGRNAESWTIDGMELNDLTFVVGIEDGKPLFRDIDKANNPLPRFSATMLAPDIAQLFEASYRVALGTPLMSIDSLEPAKFAGSDGFRFTYSLTHQGDEVRRKGEAHGAVIDKRLYLITFEAPAIHYYERDRAAARRIAESATLTRPAQ